MPVSRGRDDRRRRARRGPQRADGPAEAAVTLGGETLIASRRDRAAQGGAERVVVVAPPASGPKGPAIAARGRTGRGRGARPRAPARPKCVRSVELGLSKLAIDPPPHARAPRARATAPGITAELVARLVETALERPGCIVVPFS